MFFRNSTLCKPALPEFIIFFKNPSTRKNMFVEFLVHSSMSVSLLVGIFWYYLIYHYLTEEFYTGQKNQFGAAPCPGGPLAPLLPPPRGVVARQFSPWVGIREAAAASAPLVLAGGKAGSGDRDWRMAVVIGGGGVVV
jgi:hypothetical protein